MQKNSLKLLFNLNFKTIRKEGDIMRITFEDLKTLPDKIKKVYFLRLLDDGFSDEEVMHINDGENILILMKSLKEDVYDNFIKRNIDTIKDLKTFSSFFVVEKIDIEFLRKKLYLTELYDLVSHSLERDYETKEEKRKILIDKKLWTLFILLEDSKNGFFEQFDFETLQEIAHQASKDYIQLYVEQCTESERLSQRRLSKARSEIEFIERIKSYLDEIKSVKRVAKVVVEKKDILCGSFDFLPGMNMFYLFAGRRKFYDILEVVYNIYKNTRIDICSLFYEVKKDDRLSKNFSFIVDEFLAALIPFSFEDFILAFMKEIKRSQLCCYVLFKFFPDIYEEYCKDVYYSSFECIYPFVDKDFKDETKLKINCLDGVFSGRGFLNRRGDVLDSLFLCMFKKDEILKSGKIPDFFDWKRLSHYAAKELGDFLCKPEFLSKFNWKVKALSLALYAPKAFSTRENRYPFIRDLVKERYKTMSIEELERYFVELKKKLKDILR